MLGSKVTPVMLMPSFAPKYTLYAAPDLPLTFFKSDFGTRTPVAFNSVNTPSISMSHSCLLSRS